VLFVLGGNDMDTFGEDTFAGDNNASIAFASLQRLVDVETSDRPDQTKSKVRFSCFEISLPNWLLNFARDTSTSRISHVLHVIAIPVQ
jgi:hypothetical protein